MSTPNLLSAKLQEECSETGLRTKLSSLANYPQMKQLLWRPCRYVATLTTPTSANYFS
mgnify:CR=1 FL=1